MTTMYATMFSFKGRHDHDDARALLRERAEKLARAAGKKITRHGKYDHVDRANDKGRTFAAHRWWM